MPSDANFTRKHGKRTIATWPKILPKDIFNLLQDFMQMTSDRFDRLEEVEAIARQLSQKYGLNHS